MSRARPPARHLLPLTNGLLGVRRAAGWATALCFAGSCGATAARLLVAAAALLAVCASVPVADAQSAQRMTAIAAPTGLCEGTEPPPPSARGCREIRRLRETYQKAAKDLKTVTKQLPAHTDAAVTACGMAKDDQAIQALQLVGQSVATSAEIAAGANRTWINLAAPALIKGLKIWATTYARKAAVARAEANRALVSAASQKGYAEYVKLGNAVAGFQCARARSAKAKAQDFLMEAEERTALLKKDLDFLLKDILRG